MSKYSFFGPKTGSTPGIVDASTGQAKAESGDNAGKLALVSDLNISLILVELKLISMLLAQRFGVTEELDTLRNDPDPTITLV